jgi:hypothetical protein
VDDSTLKGRQRVGDVQGYGKERNEYRVNRR